MTESTDPLALFSDRLVALIDRAARGLVAVHSRKHRSISGMHWRSGVLVTAEEALDRDEDIEVSLPDGRTVPATLAGRDPSTDVAALRFQPDGLPVVETAPATGLRAGHFVLALGRYEGGPLASQGIVAYAGAAWQSLRGGTIDQFLRLDLALSPAAEGGALIDAGGKVLGMAVLGPRRRALAIPASTIDRAVDQLLAKGHVARGYLGAGLQPVRLHGERRRGVLAISIDSDGPAAKAGLLVGDIIVQWNGEDVGRVREIMRQLGTDSIGKVVELTLLRGGGETKLSLALGERPLA
jgi:S1-C subfamily serine protease